MENSSGRPLIAHLFDLHRKWAEFICVAIHQIGAAYNETSSVLTPLYGRAQHVHFVNVVGQEAGISFAQKNADFERSLFASFGQLTEAVRPVVCITVRIADWKCILVWSSFGWRLEEVNRMV